MEQKTITTKANNIDVSNFKFADTTGMYTAAEYVTKTGAGEYWKKGEFTLVAGKNTINVGFEPSEVYIYGYSTSNSEYYEMFYLTKSIKKCAYKFPDT